MTSGKGLWLAVCALSCRWGAGSTIPGASTPSPPLIVQTDTIEYQIQSDTVYPGHYRLRLSIRLENRTRDTVWLAYPCNGGPSPQRTFLRARDLSTTVIGGVVCTSSSGSAELKPVAFPVPPTVPLIDTVDARLFRAPFWNKETRSEPYAGTYRLAYTRWIRRGFLRRSWTLAPLTETMSNEFLVVAAK